MRPGRVTTFLLALASSALTASAPPNAAASTSIALPLDELLHESTAAALVTPVSETSVWEGGRIVTYTDARVDAVVAGDALERDVWVRTFGGEVGHVGQSVEGEAVLSIGRQSLLFLRPATLLGGDPSLPPTALPGVFSVTGRAQGQFPVVSEQGRPPHVVRSSGIDGVVAPKGPAGVLASEALHGLPVTGAIDAVSRAWGSAHAR